MWSNVISIDKSFDKETDFIVNNVRGIKNMSYAVEESKNRLWVYVASICEVSEEVEERVTDIVETVVLTYIKLRFFLDKLSLGEMTHSNCALISSLVHFDRTYESNLFRKALSETADFNVDGLYNFRMNGVVENWEELASLAEKLLKGSDKDVFDVASFITATEGTKCRLAVIGGKLYNLTERAPVEILPLFPESELNMISAIIKEKPVEIIVENTSFTPSMTSTLKHIAPVINK